MFNLFRYHSGGVYKSSEDYLSTVQKLWNAMTFCEGNAALSPKCRCKKSLKDNLECGQVNLRLNLFGIPMCCLSLFDNHFDFFIKCRCKDYMRINFLGLAANERTIWSSSMSHGCERSECSLSPDRYLDLSGPKTFRRILQQLCNQGPGTKFTTEIRNR